MAIQEALRAIHASNKLREAAKTRVLTADEQAYINQTVRYLNRDMDENEDYITAPETLR